MNTRKARAPSSPSKGSRNAWLSTMAVGEERFVSTTPDTWAHDMRMYNSAPSRRPASMTGMTFTCSLWTAVGAKFGAIRYLLSVTRLT